jgi:predicted  nucleic acid-binding Zn-ribbon protein
MPSERFQVWRHSCLRCEHVWIARSETPPTQCARCRSPYWNTPYKKRLKEVAPSPAAALSISSAKENIPKVDDHTLITSAKGIIEAADVPQNLKVWTVEEVQAQAEANHPRWKKLDERGRAAYVRGQVKEMNERERRDAERLQRVKDREIGLLPPIDEELDEPTE